VSQSIPVYWEDFVEGQKFVTRSRTITETDVVMFAGLTGDYNPLHTDAEYAKTTIYGQRIGHGLLGLSVANGLRTSMGIAQGATIALLGLTWDFVGPILFGDTIHAVLAVAEKRETRQPDRGIIVWDIEVVNQRGEVIQKGQQKFLLRRRGAEAS
jgi:acyl dehydratase